MDDIADGTPVGPAGESARLVAGEPPLPLLVVYKLCGARETVHPMRCSRRREFHCLPFECVVTTAQVKGLDSDFACV